jgi:hypothetical protein
VLSCEAGHAKCTRILPASSKDPKSVRSLEEFCEFPDVPVILRRPFPFHVYIFGVSVWVMALLIYQLSVPGHGNFVRQGFCR